MGVTLNGVNAGLRDAAVGTIAAAAVVLGVYVVLPHVGGASDARTPVLRPAASPTTGVIPTMPALPIGTHDVQWLLEELRRRQVEMCRSVLGRAYVNGADVGVDSCGTLPTPPATVPPKAS